MSRRLDTYHKVLSPLEKAAGEKDWYTIGREVREMYNYCCAEPGCGLYLGKTGGHVHHIQKLSGRGITSKTNLILLCDTHHEKRHTHLIRKPTRSSYRRRP